MQQLLVHDIQIPHKIEVLTEIFFKYGFKLYLVGGCVRDSLLGIPPKDFDLVTDAPPGKIVEICQLYGFKTGEVGINFGIVFVYVQGEQYEIATFRTDGKDRKSNVMFGATIHDDVLRRDFTCNGLYYDSRLKVIIDYVGGIEDIRSRVLRTIGSPTERFAEDPLRRLRAIRMACRYGFKMNSALMYELNDKIGVPLNVSAERIRDEFVKAANSMFKDDFTQYCQSFNHYGFMKEMIGISYNGNKYHIHTSSYIAQVAHYMQSGGHILKGWSREELRDINLIHRFILHDWFNVLKDCNNIHLYQYACATNSLDELVFIKNLANEYSFTFQYLRDQLSDSMRDSEVGAFRRKLINNVKNLYIHALTS